MTRTQTLRLLTSVLLAACVGCGLSPPPTRGPSATAPPSASQPAPTAPPTEVPGPVPAVDTCPAGTAPEFALGFGELKAWLGDRMGEPLSCERFGPEGDALQQTTRGLARYRKGSNTPSFTSGSEHWALTGRGFVYWTGRALDPPEDATVLETPDEAQAAQERPTPPALATAIPSASRIRLPAEDPGEVIPGLPRWLQKALILLQEYDRWNGTVLVPSIARTAVAARPLGGAWGMFVPRTRILLVDTSLASESPEAVATVLAHEADHAVDTFHYGPPANSVGCYTFEISAFALQARVWESLQGPSGKPDPQTPLEEELNLILKQARTNAGALIEALKSNYRDECD